MSMNKNSNKIPRILLILSVASLAILAISMLSLSPIINAKATATAFASASASDITVTRTLSTKNPAPGSTCEVSLNITALQIGGIVETIPDGFAFVSTTHPNVSVSGQKVVFAVLNETSIKYEVRALQEGGGTFRGIWYDALNAAEGDIKSTSVSVRIPETPTPSPAVTPALTPALTPTSTPSPPVPGFEVVFALAGLLIAAYLVLFMKKGDKGKESE